MKRFSARLSTLLCLLPLSACARYAPLLDVQVVDQDQGYTLPTLPYAGRDYLEGQPGHRFSVVLQNRSGGRVLAVLSVDGVNAISGQTAGSSQAGYVVEPWQRVEIRGWRKNYSEVNEFYFSTFADSYATRTGRPQNLGVIGVAAFRERQRQPEPLAYAPPAPSTGTMGSAMEKSAADSASVASGSRGRLNEPESRSAAPQQLGTGYGDRRYDPVTQTTFERESARPNQVASLFYDSYDALVARGIIPTRGYSRTQPDPFPLGFVPEPPR
jgi:hypothetical protein